MPYVICTLGGDEDPWLLPASVFSERAWIHGGERGLYELAAAIALTGAEVELRGELSRPDLDELAATTGARPRTVLPPRRPTSQDVVIVPEGWPDPISYARVSLSPARAVLLILAPPGLFGWPFLAGWAPPDPLTVPIDSLARPEHFRAMRTLGFTLWTHSSEILRRARDAGVRITFVGEGQPVPFPPIPTKTREVVYLEDNRWASLSRQVAERLSVRVYPLPRSDHSAMLRGIAGAHLLILPSRVEGTSRIQWEARAMGTVPVALSTNPFAEGLDEDHGAVTVGSVDEMPGVIERLLRAPERLEELSMRGIRSARAQIDWEAYRARIVRALESLDASDDGLPARAGFGQRIEDLLRRSESTGTPEVGDVLIAGAPTHTDRPRRLPRWTRLFRGALGSIRGRQQ